MDRDQQLQEIAGEISICTQCPLSNTRKNSVPGEGPSNAPIMFIGEAPGFHENEQGRPFVGAAGKLLDKLLDGIGMNRKDVVITNVVKCRPPGNRDPQEEEITICTNTYLNRQIEIINPQMIVTLGRYSMGLFFENARISELHGKAKKNGHRWIVAMYHPAAALHQPKLLEVIHKDFSTLPGLIEDTLQKPRQDHPDAVTDPNRNPDDQPGDPLTQLSLF